MLKELREGDKSTGLGSLSAVDEGVSRDLATLKYTFDLNPDVVQNSHAAAGDVTQSGTERPKTGEINHYGTHVERPVSGDINSYGTGNEASNNNSRNPYGTSTFVAGHTISKADSGSDTYAL